MDGGMPYVCLYMMEWADGRKLGFGSDQGGWVVIEMARLLEHAGSFVAWDRGRCDCGRWAIDLSVDQVVRLSSNQSINQPLKCFARSCFLYTARPRPRLRTWAPGNCDW